MSDPTPKRFCWLDFRYLTDSAIAAVLRQVPTDHVHAALFARRQLAGLDVPSGVRVGVHLREAEGVTELPEFVRLVVSEGDAVLRAAKEKGLDTARLAVVKDRESMERSLDVPPWVDAVIADIHDETNIPLELIIATFQNRRERAVLLKLVPDAEAGMVALGVMEVGTAGVLVQSDVPEELVRMGQRLTELARPSVEISTGRVRAVRHVGMGERSCIDTTSLIAPDEALIVGSTSSGGLLVCSEVHPLPYMETRPFRFNAGAVHSYVWCPAGMTQYITELKAGSQVLVVSTSGASRAVTVGRSKIETRPLLLIEVESELGPLSIAMQDDWHVRVFGGAGEVRNITTLRPGDEVLIHGSAAGRHVGIQIEEQILEK